MRTINHIVIHHSASPLSTTAAEIRLWHLQKGWGSIGYNLVIERTGQLILGRPVHVVPAQVRRHNAHSIGICLVGDNTHSQDRWLPVQIEMLEQTLGVLTVLYSDAVVLGHRDLPGTATTCPGLDVRNLLGLNPLSGNETQSATLNPPTNGGEAT